MLIIYNPLLYVTIQYKSISMINGGPWRKYMYSLVSLDFVCAYSMHGLFSLCALASDVVALQQVHVQVHLHARRHVYRKEYAVTLRCGTPILRTSSGYTLASFYTELSNTVSFDPCQTNPAREVSDTVSKIPTGVKIAVGGNCEHRHHHWVNFPIRVECVAPPLCKRSC